MRSIIKFLFVSMALIACEKESTPLTTAEALASSKWQLKKVEVASPPGTTPGDVTLTHFKICELDDIIEFKADGTYACSENIQVCFPGNNSPFYRIANGNWTLSNGDSMLIISNSSDAVSMRIQSASSHKVDLRQRHFNLQMMEMEYIFTLEPIK